VSKSVVTGQDKLRKKLMALQAHLENNVIPRELQHGAQVFVARVQANAPEDTGALAGSVEVHANRDRPGTRSVKVEVTGGHPDRIIGHIEYGTLNEEPNLFIRRSFFESVKQVMAGIASGIARGVRKFSKG
jgi:HK97 gp10 family phage protein